ncbi:DNA polymerase III subunit chi [Thalassovita sp.]|uniref:DNA polymerase III subunit chi n=1 Tax=Thalassovita sp. TaxID=1979401 RepID=UPI0029DE7D94|nr:DNA polymerase III subunit chi [Thalassovita sp.]
MGAAFFYHLTRDPVETTLAMLAGKSLERGWKVAVRGTDLARMDWLDQKLWLGRDDGFLPHGLAGGPHDALQPILLTSGEVANGAECLVCVDGAQVSADEVNGMERVCILFDGHDPDAVQHARGQWKALTDAGCSAQYWSEESGRWEKKAEK